jgi:hypothetical protein
MSGQNLDRQTRGLTDVGCIWIFASKLPCKTAVPSSPCAWITSARGDTLVVAGRRRHAVAPWSLPRWVTTLTDHDTGNDRPARHPGPAPDHLRGAVPQTAPAHARPAAMLPVDRFSPGIRHEMRTEDASRLDSSSLDAWGRRSSPGPHVDLLLTMSRRGVSLCPPEPLTRKYDGARKR